MTLFFCILLWLSLFLWTWRSLLTRLLILLLGSLLLRSFLLLRSLLVLSLLTALGFLLVGVVFLLFLLLCLVETRDVSTRKQVGMLLLRFTSLAVLLQRHGFLASSVHLDDFLSPFGCNHPKV